MNAPFLSWTLNVVVNGRAGTFKIAAESLEDATKKCVEYFHDNSLPKEVHKDVTVTGGIQETWKPEMR